MRWPDGSLFIASNSFSQQELLATTVIDYATSYTPGMTSPGGRDAHRWIAEIISAGSTQVSGRGAHASQGDIVIRPGSGRCTGETLGLSRASLNQSGHAETCLELSFAGIRLDGAFATPLVSIFRGGRGVMGDRELERPSSYPTSWMGCCGVAPSGDHPGHGPSFLVKLSVQDGVLASRSCPWPKL